MHFRQSSISDSCASSESGPRNSFSSDETSVLSSALVSPSSSSSSSLSSKEMPVCRWPPAAHIPENHATSHGGGRKKTALGVDMLNRRSVVVASAEAAEAVTAEAAAPPAPEGVEVVAGPLSTQHARRQRRCDANAKGCSTSSSSSAGSPAMIWSAVVEEDEDEDEEAEEQSEESEDFRRFRVCQPCPSMLFSSRGCGLYLRALLYSTFF